jgi:hypothetical protein
MPQASDELRNLIEKWFGSMEQYGPEMFLRSHGYTSNKSVWSKPTPSHNPSCEEVSCILFLRDEWDHDFLHPLFPEYVS